MMSAADAGLTPEDDVAGTDADLPVLSMGLDGLGGEPDEAAEEEAAEAPEAREAREAAEAEEMERMLGGPPDPKDQTIEDLEQRTRNNTREMKNERAQADILHLLLHARVHSAIVANL